MENTPLANSDLILSKLNSDFISYCKYEKNLSEKTIKSYTIDLKQLIGFIAENDYSMYIDDIDKKVLKEYLQKISYLKPKTVKRKIATIKALYNFLEFEEIISVNPFRKMKIQIKEPRTLPKVMSIDEVGKIIKYAYKEMHQEKMKKTYGYAQRVRNVAVVELLFATGIRVSELSTLKEENIELNIGLIKVRGKGDKERVIQICNKETLTALNEYLKIFRDKLYQSAYFFINRFNKRLSEQSIRFLVKSLAKKAGIKRTITPHVFRHSFATLLLEEDVDIKYIQHLLGHSSIMTTQIYTHVNNEKQKQILSKKHPRKNIIINDISLVT